MEIYSYRRFSWGAAFWALAGTAVLVAGLLLGNRHLLILAPAPLLLAVGLWFFRPGIFRCVLGEDCLEIEKPACKIPYEEIEGLTMAGKVQDPQSARLKPGHLILTHRRGIVEIPRCLNVPVEKLFQAIFAKIPFSSCYQLSESMDGHYKTEEATFGPDRVHAFTFRSIWGRGRSTRCGRYCALFLLACGIFWCLAPLIFPQPVKKGDLDIHAWIGFGSILVVVSLMSLLVLYLEQYPQQRGLKKMDNSEMVISPTGIALIQGELKGHLRWDELTKVRFLDHRRFAINSTDDLFGGIVLFVPGTEIRIPDVFDRPLPLIHQLIRRYWKGE
jgi:hypothetical protein